jgi:hypothetical protein
MAPDSGENGRRCAFALPFGKVRRMHQVGMVRAVNPFALLNLGLPSSVPAARRDQYNPRGNVHEQQNPSTSTWLLIFGASAAAVGGLFALLSRGKSKAPTIPTGPTGPTQPPGGGGNGPVGKHCNYVDCEKAIPGPAFVWPHKNIWTNSRQLATELKVLGYNPGNINDANWSMIKQTAMDAVLAFQADYNYVRTYWQQAGLSPAPSAPELVEDGFMGKNTVNALYDASLWSAAQTWESVVQQAAAAAGEA